MKKTIATILCLMLIAGIIPFNHTAMAAADYSWIKVKLSTGNVTSLAMPVSGGYFIQENGREFNGGTLYVTCAGGVLTLTHSSGGTLFTGSSCQVMRENVAPSAGSISILTVHGNRKYLGHFNLSATYSGIQVVNVVPLAHYLYGVVGYEMSNSFPLEALKAQAVVAKSYVLSGMNTSGAYYIGDTSSDQVYKGYDPSLTNVIHAVDSTLEVVMKYGGSILKTYYAASNGGETNLVSYAWSSSGSNGGYAIALDDYDFKNPNSLQEKLYFADDPARLSYPLHNFLLSKASMALGTSVASIISLDSVYAHSPRYSSASRNMTKMHIEMTVTLGSGSFPVGGFSSPFSSSFVGGFSTSFSSSFGGSGFNTSEGLSSSFGGLTSTFGGTASSSTSPSGSGTVQNVSTNTGSNGQTKVSFDFAMTDLVNAGLFTNTSLRIFWGEKVSGGYNLYHVRYGHGVGLSQRGAQQRALTGQSYKTILKFYYPSATIGTITVNPPKNPEKPALTPIAMGVTTASGVNMRKKADRNSSRVTKLKSKGTELTIYSLSNGWYYVQAGKYKGYVSAEYVEITQDLTAPVTPVTPQTPTSPFTPFTPDSGGLSSTFGGFTSSGSSATTNNGFTSSFGSVTAPSAPPTTPSGSSGTTTGTAGFVNANDVNFRAHPSRTSTSYGKLSYGTQVTVLSRFGDWYNVRIGSQEGYIFATYVTVN